MAIATSPVAAPRRRGRPPGSRDEQSIVPVFKSVPVALSCMMCGRDFGEFEVEMLPRGILKCAHCNGRVLMTAAGPRTTMGATGLPAFIGGQGSLHSFYMSIKDRCPMGTGPDPDAAAVPGKTVAVGMMTPRTVSFRR